MSFIFLPGIKVTAETDYDGKIVKMEGLSNLYYVMDGKRYVFPNEKIYKSWFNDFSDITILNQEEISKIPLVGNVKYRPGMFLIKTTNNPKVYAVGDNGKLHWVKTETLARKLYGENWSLLVDDLPEVFWGDYQEVEAIEDENDYDVDEEINNNNTIEKNHGLHLGQLKQKRYTHANTVKCRAIPATPAVPAKKSPTGKKIPAIPATPASRICRVETPPDEDDTQAPVISNISVSVLYNSATVNWDTNESANAAVVYSKNDFVNSTTVSSNVTTTNHFVILNSLTASTTYQYYVKSTDSSGNMATSSIASFITTDEPDTQIPVISDLSVIDISSTTATVIWTTDELANSAVIFSSNDYVSSTTVSATDLVTSHSLILNNLTATTTYQYYVESEDASNNTATSSQYSFVTLEE